MYAYVSDPRVLEHLSMPAQSLEDAEAYIAAARHDGEQDPRTSYRLAITSRYDGALVGDCLLKIDSPVRDRQGAIGFVLAAEQWNRGYGTETARLLVGLGLKWVGLHRVYAIVRPDNIGSIRVLEKAGLRLEGRFREHRFIRGRWRDSLVYGVVAGDVQAVRDT
jgi:RimJ/RimL family protein N-acetyltransferase